MPHRILDDWLENQIGYANIENFGIKSLEEIRQFLNEHNLHFGMKLEEGEAGDLYLVEREAAPASADAGTEAAAAKPDEE